MAAPPAQTLTFSGILSESKRIVRTHSRHFLALSVLFLLPISFTLVISPSLPTTTTAKSLLKSSSRPDLDTLLPLVQTLFVFFMAVFGIGAITYSTYTGFYGRPLKLKASVVSLLYSFLPLVGTYLVLHALVGMVSGLVLMVVGGVFKFVENFGVEVDYESSDFMWVWVVAGVILILVVGYFHVVWGLAYVIVVVESKWGFKPLRRSAYLTKGMRLVSLSLQLFYGCAIGFVIWAYSGLVLDSSRADDWVSRSGFVIKCVLGSSMLTIFMLQSVVANTVLYMYCKALHGELALEIVEEFAREYVSLPFDDEKVPHVVTLIQD